MWVNAGGIGVLVWVNVGCIVVLVLKDTGCTVVLALLGSANIGCSVVLVYFQDVYSELSYWYYDERTIDVKLR